VIERTGRTTRLGRVVLGAPRLTDRIRRERGRPLVIDYDSIGLS